MSIIDRILNGDFDDEQDSTPSTKTSSLRGSAGTKPRNPEPAEEPHDDEEQDGVDEEEGTEEEWDESDWEDDMEGDIEDSSVVVLHDPDVPSEEYCRKVMQSIDPASVVEAETAQAPKNSEFKKPRKIMTNENKPATNTVQPDAAPKNSTTENAKPGRPAKLAAHTDEVVRLYGEGLSAKGIADKFGVSISCVFNCLKAAGVAIRPRGRRKAN